MEQTKSILWKKINDIVNKNLIVSNETITTELEQLIESIPLNIDIKKQKEEIFNAYKEGFNSATESLIGANKMIQNKYLNFETKVQN